MKNLEFWSESLFPRIEAKAFGVPIKRQVLKVQLKSIARVQLLTEVSKTDNGKFFIVVFKRYTNKK